MTTCPAHLSIHDVKPSNLERVRRLVELARSGAGPRITLLVVPGLDWEPGKVDRLRAWSREGLELAGHGWVHRGPPRSLYHKVHGLVLSRDQAEHLSRTRQELMELVARGFAWFGERDLPAPGLYVPPAWALGALRRRDLPALPYRWYEVLQGFLEAGEGHLYRTPLVGYEADTGFRRRALRVTNGLARAIARATGRPLRIGLHPRDLDLLLADDVRRDLADPGWRFLSTPETLARLGAALRRTPGPAPGGRTRDEEPQRPTE